MIPKVFVSYAHESEDLSNRVLDFSNQLRRANIDAEIDQYEESPPEGWPKWMARNIQESDFVLVCCSRLLFERANDFSGEETGLGVKWETNLILQQLYVLNTNNTKFIPVVFDPSWRQYIPLSLQPYTYYDLSLDADVEKLRTRLKGETVSKRPPLGGGDSPGEDIPQLEEKRRKTMFLSSIIDVDMWNEADWKGTAYFTEANNLMAPIVGFIFGDEEIGAQIFESIREQVGEVDEKEQLRISFISDPTEEYPKGYRVHFGRSRDASYSLLEEYGLEPKDTLVFMITRFLIVTPSDDSVNLEVFRKSLEVVGNYGLTNVVSRGGQLVPDLNNIISKQKALFRSREDVLGLKDDEDFVVFSKKPT